MNPGIKALAEDLARIGDTPAVLDTRNLNSLDREELVDLLRELAPHIAILPESQRGHASTSAARLDRSHP